MNNYFVCDFEPNRLKDNHSIGFIKKNLFKVLKNDIDKSIHIIPVLHNCDVCMTFVFLDWLC